MRRAIVALPLLGIAAAIVLLGAVTLGVGGCARRLQSDPAPVVAPCPPAALICIPI